MEKKKNNFLYIVLGVLLVLLLLAAIKALNNHHEKEYLVVNNKILESAKKCYLNKECEGDITLKDLYDKGYLDKVFDPVTKEAIDEKKCITFENDEAKFC